MSSRSVVALLAFLVLLSAGVGVGQGHGAASPTASTDAVSAQSSGQGETTLRVQIRPNGDARWTITANFSIDSADQRADFEALAEDFESDNAPALGLETFREASRAASAATGRDMTIANVEKSHAIHNDTGQLVLQFTWSNFARVTGDHLRIDDAFNTTREPLLQGLAANQELVLVSPSDYRIVRASPQGYTLTNGSIRWEGPRTFGPGDIEVTYQRIGPQTTTPPTTTTPPGSGFDPAVIGLFVVVAVAIVGGLTYLFTGRDDDQPAPSGAVDADTDGGGETQSVDAGGDAATGELGAGATADDEIDEELLSDEERIERLLERNGGRMKQANIVKETGWSNAKVSQLLSAMDQDDRIDKLRIGRENLISFPDEDVTDLDSEE